MDISSPRPDTFDLLVALGALDIQPVDNELAAILAGGVTRDVVTGALRVRNVTVSAAVARDDGSVCLLSPRDIRIGHVLIASPETEAPPKALRLTD